MFDYNSLYAHKNTTHGTHIEIGHERQLCDVIIQGGTPVPTQLGSSTKTSPVLVPSIPMIEKSRNVYSQAVSLLHSLSLRVTVLNWQDYICSYRAAPSSHTDYDFRLIWRVNTIPSR